MDPAFLRVDLVILTANAAFLMANATFLTGDAAFVKMTPAFLKGYAAFLKVNPAFLLNGETFTRTHAQRCPENSHAASHTRLDEVAFRCSVWTFRGGIIL